MHPAVFPSAALRAGAILWAPFSIRPAVRDAMSRLSHPEFDHKFLLSGTLTLTADVKAKRLALERLRPCIVARAQDEEVALVPLATFDGKPYHVFDDVRRLIIPFGDRSYHLPEVSETTEVRLDTKKGWKPAQGQACFALAFSRQLSLGLVHELKELGVVKLVRRDEVDEEVLERLLDLSLKRRVAIAKDMVQET